jgi:hypothetical protein
MFDIFFKAMLWASHPFDTYRFYSKWWHRPKVGDLVLVHDTNVKQVVKLGETDDDLIFADGSNASWIHCCGWPDK